MERKARLSVLVWHSGDLVCRPRRVGCETGCVVWDARQASPCGMRDNCETIESCLARAKPARAAVYVRQVTAPVARMEYLLLMLGMAEGAGHAAAPGPLHQTSPLPLRPVCKTPP